MRQWVEQKKQALVKQVERSEITVTQAPQLLKIIDQLSLPEETLSKLANSLQSLISSPDLQSAEDLIFCLILYYKLSSRISTNARYTTVREITPTEEQKTMLANHITQTTNHVTQTTNHVTQTTNHDDLLGEIYEHGNEKYAYFLKAAGKRTSGAADPLALRITRYLQLTKGAPSPAENTVPNPLTLKLEDINEITVTQLFTYCEQQTETHTTNYDMLLELVADQITPQLQSITNLNTAAIEANDSFFQPLIQLSIIMQLPEQAASISSNDPGEPHAPQTTERATYSSPAFFRRMTSDRVPSAIGYWLFTQTKTVALYIE